jgi:hypothetical protein
MTEDRALVNAVFPNRDIVSMSTSRAGNFKRTVAVWFEAHDPVVVQYSSETSLRTEGELTRAIGGRTSVPVPRILEIGGHRSASYIVSELAPGQNLHSHFTGLDRGTQRHISREFGRYLGEIHEAFDFDGVGPVSSTGGSECLRFNATETDDFAGWFRRYAREGIEVLPEAFDPVRGRLADAILSRPYESGWEPRLFPWDLRPGNALALDGELSAVLDWGDPLAAPPELAVAKARHLVADWYVEDAQPLRSAFRDGYESVRAYPTVPTAFELVGVVRSAVDSHGVVTRPRYPEWTGDEAVQFHLDRLTELLSATDED